MESDPVLEWLVRKDIPEGVGEDNRETPSKALKIPAKSGDWTEENIFNVGTLRHLCFQLLLQEFYSNKLEA